MRPLYSCKQKFTPPAACILHAGSCRAIANTPPVKRTNDGSRQDERTRMVRQQEKRVNRQKPA